MFVTIGQISIQVRLYRGVKLLGKVVKLMRVRVVTANIKLFFLQLIRRKIS